MLDSGAVGDCVTDDAPAIKCAADAGWCGAGPNNAGSLYGAQGPILSGTGNLNATTALGNIGNFNRIQGTGTFGIGTSVYDQFRNGGLLQANGSNGNWTGDAQISRAVFRGKGTAGTIDILSDGGVTRTALNAIMPQMT